MPPFAWLCVLNVCDERFQLHRYGGSWASSFTPILQEQMDERVWQERTLCTAAAATAAPHYLVFLGPVSIKWVGRRSGKNTHTTQQLHRCFSFMKKEEDE